MLDVPVPRVLFRLLAVTLFLAFAFHPAARGQTGLGFNPGSGANDFVFHVTEQTDGRVLIGGRFTTYNGVARSGVARLYADGSLDPSFDPGSGTVGNVYDVIEQANGQVLIAGNFTVYDGVAQAGIARLNADGSLDPTFDPGTGPGGKVVFKMAGQVDGKLVIVGEFTTFNGAPRAGVVRLNPDGSVDNTFDPGTGLLGNNPTNNGGYDVYVQPDGRILIGGFFNTYNGTVQTGIVRVNTDGTLDPSFATGNGVGHGNYVQTIVYQPDGGIVLGGNFIRFNNTAAGGIVRLGADGSIDSTFNAGAGAAGRSDVVYSAVLQADGKIVVGGDFDTFNGVASDGIVRLNADGSVDNTFNTNGGVGSSYVYDASLQTDGAVLLGGNFTTVGGYSSPSVARLDANGGNESANVVTIDTNLHRIGPTQSSTSAIVTLTRSGNLRNALTVDYTTAGAAVSGVDYASLRGHRTIPAGAANVAFSVVSKEPVGAPPGELLAVKVVLVPGNGYTVGSVLPFAKIKIIH